MSTWKRWGMWTGLAALAVFVTWAAWRGVTEAQHDRLEVHLLEVRRAQLEEANRVLRREVAALRSELVAKQRAARQVLDVTTPGEVLVIIPPTPTPLSGANEAQAK